MQVMSNASYADSAHSIGLALQRYAAQRHPYKRAADEVELAILAAGVHAAGSSTGSAVGAAVQTQQEEL